MKKECRQDGWATVAVAASFFGLTTQAVRQTYIAKLSNEDVNRSARPMQVRVAAIVELMVQQRVSELSREDPMSPGDGADGDSFGIERYRMIRAEHAELDLRERKGELIEVDKAKEIFGRWAVIIRRMGDRLTKRFGNDATVMVHESLDECRSAVREVVK